MLNLACKKTKWIRNESSIYFVLRSKLRRSEWAFTCFGSNHIGAFYAVSFWVLGRFFMTSTPSHDGGTVLQRTLAIGVSITVRLVFNLTRLDFLLFLWREAITFKLVNWRPAVQWYFPQRWVFSEWSAGQWYLTKYYLNLGLYFSISLATDYLPSVLFLIESSLKFEASYLESNFAICYLHLLIFEAV